MSVNHLSVNLLSISSVPESESVVAQSCPTVGNPMDYSPPGSSVPGILQARILEWVAIPFCKGSSQLKDQIQSPTLQADYLLSELPGRPTTTHGWPQITTGAPDRKFCAKKFTEVLSGKDQSKRSAG